MLRSLLAAFTAVSMLALTACEAPAPASPTMRMTVDQVQEHLDASWKALDRGNKVLWVPVNSPFFPAEWPPTKTTLWTQYVYAQGIEPGGLVDAVRVSAAWARVERRPGEDAVKVVELLTKLESADTQGVTPLSSDSAAVLAKREAVTAYALKLTAAPVEADSATADMRAFYREWLRTNGAFAATIKAQHAAFFAWLAG